MTESLTGDDTVEQHLLRALTKAAAATTNLRPAQRLAAVQQGGAPKQRTISAGMSGNHR